MWDMILQGCAWIIGQLALIVGDCGLAIIIVTLIIRLALFPLQRKQFKSTHDMQKVQPRINKIQERYAGDQAKISEETMKVYSEIGFNPLAGCIPMLVQMPVFIILFQTLRYHLGDLVSMGVDPSFYNILSDLTMTVKEAGFAITYVIAAILFILMSVGPMAYQLMNQPNNQQQQTTTIMLIGFSAMFIWMAWISPAGVILYWALSSGFGFVQQLVTNRKLKNKDAEEEAILEPVKPLEINVERRERKKRPHKKR